MERKDFPPEFTQHFLNQSHPHFALCGLLRTSLLCFLDIMLSSLSDPLFFFSVIPLIFLSQITLLIEQLVCPYRQRRDLTRSDLSDREIVSHELLFVRPNKLICLRQLEVFETTHPTLSWIKAKDLCGYVAVFTFTVQHKVKFREEFSLGIYNGISLPYVTHCRSHIQCLGNIN